MTRQNNFLAKEKGLAQCISINEQQRVLKWYVEPILLFGSESRAVKRLMEKSLQATEMWFISIMLRIPWAVKMTNMEYLAMKKGT